MNRFDGTAARQLDLIEDVGVVARPLRPVARPAPRVPQAPTFRLLQRDVYAQLTRRRRRAQIAARRMLDA
jgi:hypothetical protein